MAASARELEILAIIRGVLDRDDVGVDTEIFDVGATSLSFVRILAQISNDHGVAVHAPDLGESVSASTLAAVVDAAASPIAQAGPTATTANPIGV